MSVTEIQGEPMEGQLGEGAVPLKGEDAVLLVTEAL